MRTNTKLLLVALLHIKLANCFLWRLPIIYELYKSKGQEMHKFTICEKNNNVPETGANGKKILIFEPLQEPLDWECGEIAWDLDDDDNSTAPVKPETEHYKSLTLDPFNIAFLFV
uniref:Uncharacterized protein n=1 Tax=viral metagenome TaxID=1070528 RepID=A0A6C0F597_9ZZZZ